MSRMKELLEDIKEDIRDGFLSDKGIARKYDVPIEWVYIAWDQLCQEEHNCELT